MANATPKSEMASAKRRNIQLLLIALLLSNELILFEILFLCQCLTCFFYYFYNRPLAKLFSIVVADAAY
jgi:hypothetical protein